MNWEVEFTDEFEGWWNSLSSKEQETIDAKVELLEEQGPYLDFPHTSGVNGSKHGNMRELRAQCAGRPYRVLFAFDPRRCAILLIGGDKTGDKLWYKKNVPLADLLYDEHLEALLKEGESDG